MPRQAAFLSLLEHLLGLVAAATQRAGDHLAEAQAQALVADFVELGGRDEARADRAARRGHARGLRRDRPEGDLREGGLEHPGDAGPRRARDRQSSTRRTEWVTVFRTHMCMFSLSPLVNAVYPGCLS